MAMRLPIRFQFMLPLLIVAAASLTAIAVFNARSASRDTKEQIARQLRGVVGVLADSNFPLTNRVLSQMGELAGAEFLLTNDQQQVVAASNADLSLDNLTLTFPPTQTAEQISLDGPVELPSGTYYVAAVEMQERTGRSSPQTLHILFPQEDFNTAWKERFLPPLIVGLATLGAVGFVTHLVAARIGRVLRRLQTGVRLLAEGGVEPVELPNIDDEIQDLATDVNQTAERLEAYENEVRDAERLRTLSMLGAGLAHEMRNAATGCRMAIDLHSENSHAPQNGNECLEVARGQLTLMERRLDQFLQLSDNPPQDRKDMIDLGSIVNEVLQLVEPSARHSGVKLGWDYSDAGKVAGDYDQLTQVSMNLTLNALQAAAQQQAATGKQGFLRVEIERVGESIELRFTDSGPGPSEEVAPKMFDSFVTDKPEGIGLGLALARRVVKSHEGELSWSRHAGETQFVVRLPAAKDKVADG